MRLARKSSRVGPLPRGPCGISRQPQLPQGRKLGEWTQGDQDPSFDVRPVCSPSRRSRIRSLPVRIYLIESPSAREIGEGAHILFPSRARSHRDQLEPGGQLDTLVRATTPRHSHGCPALTQLGKTIRYAGAKVHWAGVVPDAAVWAFGSKLGATSAGDRAPFAYYVVRWIVSSARGPRSRDRLAVEYAARTPRRGSRRKIARLPQASRGGEHHGSGRTAMNWLTRVRPGSLVNPPAIRCYRRPLASMPANAAHPDTRTGSMSYKPSAPKAIPPSSEGARRLVPDDWRGKAERSGAISRLSGCRQVRNGEVLQAAPAQAPSSAL